MDAFSWQRADDIDAAIAAAQQPGAAFIGGGTNLLDLMKGGVAHPLKLVDITRIAALGNVETLPDGGLRIGALVRNSDAANHALIRTRYPLLTQALLAGASPQLRNMATVGGNLMQRTRCAYFYDTAFAQCNKRAPGSGCAAREGVNRMHAILGASAQCVAVNPSDMSVALAALDATVQVRGPRGARAIPIAQFHRLPAERPDQDTTLASGELITSVDLPPPAFSDHTHYLKLRDRTSYAFALVSVAVALQLDGQRVRAARIALGGVAHKPWRASRAEQHLAGHTLDAATLRSAAAAELAQARPLSGNAFKVELAQRAIVRAAMLAAASPVTGRSGISDTNGISDTSGGAGELA